MAVVKCSMCGAALELEEGKSTITCEYCGTVNQVKAVGGGYDIEVSKEPQFVKVGKGSKAFEILMWCLLIVPGIVFQAKKVKAQEELSQMLQKINQAASQVDNYMEQRVMILQNVAKLLDKAIDLDKSTFTEVARLRSEGASGFADTQRAIEEIDKKINVAFENYPDLKAHAELKDAMQQNSYTQREITAAREHYNDVVFQWNKMTYDWPAHQIVAAKRHYSTKIPFAASKEVKEQARGTFF